MVKLFGEDARDLHVAALGVSAGDVLHRNVGGGRGALLPVARCVGTFHADAGLVAFGRGGESALRCPRQRVRKQKKP